MTIWGWDLSHYDAPDSRPAIAEGFSFFTHKAGGDANDAELGTWWNLMKPYRASVLLGAYWVLYPGSAVARADQFIARLDSQCPGWRDDSFILQVDCEKWGGDPGTVPHLADIRAFCDRLKARAPKLRPIVYAPDWVYGNTLRGLEYPLWASDYVTGDGTASALYPGDGSSRWAAYSGQTPAILQFTSSARIAGQTTCDANAYRGTLKELTALVAPGWQEEIVMAELTKADVYAAVWNTDSLGAPDAATNTANPAWTGESFIRNTYNEAKRGRIAAEAALAGLSADTVDESAIVAGILAQLTPESIAGAIPTDLAEQVVSLLSARLAE